MEETSKNNETAQLGIGGVMQRTLLILKKLEKIQVLESKKLLMVNTCLFNQHLFILHP